MNIFRRKPVEWLINYGWQEVQGHHRLWAATKSEARTQFTRLYGSGFDYIEIERY